MEKIKDNLLYFGLLILTFYLLLNLIRDTGSGMLVLLVFIPIICLVISFFYGLKNGFNISYALFEAALFTPTIFIYYNSSTKIYILAYGILAFLLKWYNNFYNNHLIISYFSRYFFIGVS